MSLNQTITGILIFIHSWTYGQFGPQQIITDEAQLARDVFTADIDGDGDLDVLSASRSISGDFNIAWYENEDGLGAFGAPIVVDVSLQESYALTAADLDGDGDIDILATSLSLDRLVWYENLDGLGNYSNDKIISSSANNPLSVIAVDLDSDNDIDVITGSTGDGILAWHENDGAGNFGGAQVISSISNGWNVQAGDLDDDGDYDIVASASGSTIIFWFENLDGLGNFGSENPVASVTEPASTTNLFLVDLDGDLDLDIIANPAFPRRLVWYENDGSGNFGPEQIIALDLIGAFHLHAADLDNDGDNDVLYTSTPSAVENTSEVGWCENLDGLGNFGPKQNIINTLTFATGVHAGDVDDDGDMDVLSASQNDNTIAWYENLTILNVDEFTEPRLIIYPNPTSGIFNVSDVNLIRRIEIFDSLGNQLKSIMDQFDQVDISSLRSGLYFIVLHTDSGYQTSKIVKI
ncbi:T9SS type A sorting domain-containing protein [Gilvibacter sediminis]|uniref:T9SS type A sorting domain-containing protein n=1 Tax=Gilvibacter sediminis TaxID=379071 RepID=UPI0023509109|nr:T9SS type A sorting domain-containing protein [Gilvibacter sediminis]MDC7998398.1 T9SS type A sorting domain-containing protein [Gilvibacter sediminis]